MMHSHEFLAARFLCVFALASILLAGCSQEPAKPPRPPDTAAVSNTIAAIAAVFASDGDFRRLDVREMTVVEFYRAIESASPLATLWMPGEYDWLLVGTKHGHTNSLGSAMENFAALDSRLAFPEMFSAYVGTVSETLPAIAALKSRAIVAPQNFVTKEIPELRWLSSTDVDADIRDKVLSEIRSMQFVRREVLQGNMKALAAKDRIGEKAAIEIWSKAALRNPNDSFLRERLERLDRNARGFLKLGKVLQAMKCYETMALIKPTAAAVHNFGMCLKKIGKLDVAEKVLAHAKELEKSELCGK